MFEDPTSLDFYGSSDDLVCFDWDGNEEELFLFDRTGFYTVISESEGFLLKLSAFFGIDGWELQVVENPRMIEYTLGVSLYNDEDPRLTFLVPRDIKVAESA